MAVFIMIIITAMAIMIIVIIAVQVSMRTIVNGRRVLKPGDRRSRVYLSAPRRRPPPEQQRPVVGR